MIVAELFASLGIRRDGKSWDKARDDMGRFVKGGNKQLATIGSAIDGIAKRFAAIWAGAQIFQGAQSALAFNESLTRLDIAANGAMGSVDDIHNRILDVSDATGVAKEEILAGANAFLALTGNGKAATESMELFAKVQKATGSSMDDIAASSAAVNQNLGIMPNEFERAFSIMVAGGKAGAVELKDMAGLLAGMAPAAEKFAGGKGLAGLSKLSAAFQLVRQGAGSAAEASTMIESLMAAISGKSAKRLQKEGITVFNKDGSIRELDAIVAEIQKKGFRRDKLIEIFGRQEAVGAFEQLTKVEGAWKSLTEQTMQANDVAEDYAKFQKSTAARVSKAWNKFKNAAGRVFAVLIEGMAALIEHSDLVLAVLASLAAAMLIFKAASIAAALASAAAWVVAMLPFILMAAAILAVILIIEDLYRWITGGESAFAKLYAAAEKWIGDKLMKLYRKSADFAQVEIARMLGGDAEAERRKIESTNRANRFESDVKASADERRANIQKRAAATPIATRIAEQEKRMTIAMSNIKEGFAVGESVGNFSEAQAQLLMLKKQQAAAGPTIVQKNEITINTPAGANSQEIKKAVEEGLESQNRKAAAALGVK